MIWFGQLQGGQRSGSHNININNNTLFVPLFYSMNNTCLFTHMQNNVFLLFKGTNQKWAQMNSVDPHSSSINFVNIEWA